MRENYEKHLGIAKAMLDRLNDQRLPWLLELEKKVLAGGRLEDFELEHLEDALREAQENEHVVKTLVDEFPELAKLRSQVVDLYRTITTKALENESGEG